MRGCYEDNRNRTWRFAPPKAMKMLFDRGSVVLSQVSESKPGAPRFVVRDEFSGQIFRCAQDDSMKEWLDAVG